MKRSCVLFVLLCLLICSACSSTIVSGGPLVLEDFNFYKGEDQCIAPEVYDDGRVSIYFENDGKTARGIRVGDSIDKVIDAYKGIATKEISIRKNLGNGESAFDDLEGLMLESLKENELFIKHYKTGQSYPVNYKTDVWSILFTNGDGYALYISFSDGKVNYMTAYTPEGYVQYEKEVQEYVESKLAGIQ